MLTLPGFASAYALQGKRCPSDTGDWHYVVEKIETEFIIKRCVARVRRRDQQKGIAVCGRSDDRLSSDIAASSWPIFDNEWLTKPL
jgi:hypothetical protein